MKSDLLQDSIPDRTPILDPPGSGLPWVQKIFARHLAGPVISKLVPPSQSRNAYEHHTRVIVEKVNSVPSELRHQQVLISPILGLEDSSRFWSINGVLEHLLTVSRAIEKVILTLSSGEIPKGRADPALVKPKRPDQDFYSDFIEYAPGLLKRVDLKIKNQNLNFYSKLKFEHIWFGGMTARQWYWLLARHQGIHRKQIEKIILGISAP